MKSTLTEDEIEQYQLQLLQNLGYAYHHGYDLQPTDSPSPSYRVHTSLNTPFNSPLQRGKTGNLVPSPLQGYRVHTSENQELKFLAKS